MTTRFRTWLLALLAAVVGTVTVLVPSGCGGDRASPGALEGPAAQRKSITFDMQMGRPVGGASVRSLVQRPGISYPYDAAELASISVALGGVRLGNDCIGDEATATGRRVYAYVFLMDETGSTMSDITVTITTSQGATPETTVFDYGDLADGEGGPGPAWDQIDGNEQEWSLLYDSEPLSLTLMVKVEWTWRPVSGHGLIAFESNASDDYEIYLVPADGSAEPFRLTYLYGQSCYPSWSPDGSKLVFFLGSFLYVADIATGVSLPLGADGGILGTYPSWSPDGQRIAYEWGGTLYTVASDGVSAPTSLTAGYEPAWSPDGSRIAYRAQDDSVNTVSVSDPSDVRALGASGCFPHYSPDGSRIAFGGRSGTSAIWIVPSDGSGPPWLVPGTAAESVYSADPHWSPDGSQIVCNRAGDVCIVDASGGGLVRNLTQDWPSVDAAAAWCWAEWASGPLVREDGRAPA